MGVLISCCLRLIGYDHLEGDNSSSRRKQNINSLLSDRDNPHVDGRRTCPPPNDGRGDAACNDAMSISESGGMASSANAPYSPRGWSSPSEPQPPLVNSMPKGFREDGSKDRAKLKLNLVDSLKRSTTSGLK